MSSSRPAKWMGALSVAVFVGALSVAVYPLTARGCAITTAACEANRWKTPLIAWLIDVDRETNVGSDCVVLAV